MIPGFADWSERERFPPFQNKGNDFDNVDDTDDIELVLVRDVLGRLFWVDIRSGVANAILS